MLRVHRRLHKLEEVLHRDTAPRRFRVIMCGVDKPANLATAACRRTRRGRELTELLVALDGSIDHLSDDELDRFIDRFPVEEEV